MDISGAKNTRRFLREQVRQRDDFLAVLSHELRNPLGAVMNAVNLIDRQNATDSKPRGVHESHSRANDHMSRLLDDLLDVSRVTQTNWKCG